MRAIFTILLFFFAHTEAFADLCTPELPKGEKCRVLIDEILPTQFGVGMVDVRAKRVLLKGDEPKAYLKENRAKIVIGPGGKYYLIDRHHLTRAAYAEGFTETYAEIVDNLSAMDEAKFWQTMQERKWVRLVDEAGATRAINELPKHVRSLKNDPYRSLAWVLRQSEAFKKTDLPFAEFEWADFFRTRITIGEGKEAWEAAVKEAIRLATEQKTAKLPGHEAVKPAMRQMVQAECWKRFQGFKFGSP